MILMMMNVKQRIVPAFERESRIASEKKKQTS